MKIHRADFLEGARSAQGAVVVIDVYRAFTTLAVLHALGADPVTLVETPEEALFLRDQHGGRAVGEVSGRPCPGFDGGNSPSRRLEEGRERWAGQAVTMRTSAGVRGALAAMNQGDNVYLGAFVTGTALVNCIRRRGHDVVTLVAMGVDGERRAAEDEACADWLEALLRGEDWDAVHALADLLESEETRKFLTGMQEHFPPADPLLCLQRDLFSFALEARRDPSGLHVVVGVAD